MNHHQVVNDVQSKLPRHVQLEDVTLLTHSLPKQVTHTPVRQVIMSTAAVQNIYYNKLLEEKV